MEEHKEHEENTAAEKDEALANDHQSEETKLQKEDVEVDDKEKKESSEKPPETSKTKEEEPTTIDEETPDADEKELSDVDGEQPVKREDEPVDEDGDDYLDVDEESRMVDEDEEEAEPALPTPTQEECLALLTEVGSPQELLDHSKAVADLAQKICDMYDLHNDKKCDAQIVVAGALLHDIGRVKTHEISHNIEGSKIVKERGYSKELCLIIERHVGAGIDVSEAEELGLPRRNYIPQKFEERIVSHADNLIEGTTRIKVQALIRKLVNQDELKFAARLIRLHNKLSKLCGVELDEIE